MNKDNSSLKRNNKGRRILNFVPFEKRLVQKEEIEKRIFGKPNKKVKASKVFLIILIIIFAIVLFVTSSLYNEYIIYGINNENYKSINKFPGVYAIIDYNDRLSLLREIGFDVVKLTEEENENYTATYAYYKKGDKVDSIDIYYDENDRVKYLMLELNYKKKDYNINTLISDSNSIISNFINVSINKNKINELNNSKHIILREKDVKITYDLSTDGNYYIINIVLE